MYFRANMTWFFLLYMISIHLHLPIYFPQHFIMKWDFSKIKSEQLYNEYSYNPHPDSRIFSIFALSHICLSLYLVINPLYIFNIHQLNHIFTFSVTLHFFLHFWDHFISTCINTFSISFNASLLMMNSLIFVLK